jgi:hypothetical protein
MVKEEQSLEPLKLLADLAKKKKSRDTSPVKQK